MKGLSVATVVAPCLNAMDGYLVDVETHIGPGLVSFTLVGLPDASLREAKDRVRSALQSCGIRALIHKTTVNLSPAGIHKSGSGFDLAIALSILVASGTISPNFTAGTVFMAELALDGSLRGVSGVLPALYAASKCGVKKAVVSEENVQEAQLCPRLKIVSHSHLSNLIDSAGGHATRPITLGASLSRTENSKYGVFSEEEKESIFLPDLAQIRGQSFACRALEVAAAGGHHMLMIGEPGSGKTMLATRLVTILPSLDDETAMTVTSLHSIAGIFNSQEGLIRRPPIQLPHHSVTMAALIGGGNAGNVYPGAISLAHGGVLVLDETAEFSLKVLNALRQPLEDGTITIHRGQISASYPAAFQLILATNPCPCGGKNGCTCSSLQRRRYLSRLSGPLLDRIDIHIAMRRPTRADIRDGKSEASETVRKRVEQARIRARHRWRATTWTKNSEIPGAYMREQECIAKSLLHDLDHAVDRGILSLRGADRVMRLAWTIADLNEHGQPDDTDLAYALSLRNGMNYE